MGKKTETEKIIKHITKMARNEPLKIKDDNVAYNDDLDITDVSDQITVPYELTENSDRLGIRPDELHGLQHMPFFWASVFEAFVTDGDVVSLRDKKDLTLRHRWRALWNRGYDGGQNEDCPPYYFLRLPDRRREPNYDAYAKYTRYMDENGNLDEDDYNEMLDDVYGEKVVVFADNFRIAHPYKDCYYEYWAKHMEPGTRYILQQGTYVPIFEYNAADEDEGDPNQVTCDALRAWGIELKEGANDSNIRIKDDDDFDESESSDKNEDTDEDDDDKASSETNSDKDDEDKIFDEMLEAFENDDDDEDDTSNNSDIDKKYFEYEARIEALNEKIAELESKLNAPIVTACQTPASEETSVAIEENTVTGLFPFTVKKLQPKKENENMVSSRTLYVYTTEEEFIKLWNQQAVSKDRAEFFKFLQTNDKKMYDFIISSFVEAIVERLGFADRAARTLSIALYQIKKLANAADIYLVLDILYNKARNEDVKKEVACVVGRISKICAERKIRTSGSYQTYHKLYEMPDCKLMENASIILSVFEWIGNTDDLPYAKLPEDIKSLIGLINKIYGVSVSYAIRDCEMNEHGADYFRECFNKTYITLPIKNKKKSIKSGLSLLVFDNH